MAHEVETMAYAGDTPWHGLGKRVIADLTPAQMLKEAELDWTVEKIPAYADVRGKQIYVGKDALVRSSDGRVLDTVSQDWNPVQNETAFEFFNEFIMAGDMEMHTAGSLKSGEIVWALAKVKDSFELFNGDKVDSYLLFSNPHQYGKSIDIRFTPIRVVCNNTLTLSLNSKSDLMVRMSHRKEFDAEFVKDTLGVANQKLGTYKDMASFLGSKRFTVDTVKEYFSTVFPDIETVSTLVPSVGVKTAAARTETTAPAGCTQTNAIVTTAATTAEARCMLVRPCRNRTFRTYLSARYLVPRNRLSGRPRRSRTAAKFRM